MIGVLQWGIQVTLILIIGFAFWGAVWAVCTAIKRRFFK